MRCSRLKEVLDIFDTHIQFNELLVLKQKDVERLNTLLKTLSETLVEASENEIALSMKSRAYEKSQHLLAQ